MTDREIQRLRACADGTNLLHYGPDAITQVLLIHQDFRGVWWACVGPHKAYHVDLRTTPFESFHYYERKPIP